MTPEGPEDELRLRIHLGAWTSRNEDHLKVTHTGRGQATRPFQQGGFRTLLLARTRTPSTPSNWVPSSWVRTLNDGR